MLVYVPEEHSTIYQLISYQPREICHSVPGNPTQYKEYPC